LKIGACGGLSHFVLVLENIPKKAAPAVGFNTESIPACPGLFWTSDPFWTTQNPKKEQMMNVKDD